MNTKTRIPLRAAVEALCVAKGLEHEKRTLPYSDDLCIKYGTEICIEEESRARYVRTKAGQQVVRIPKVFDAWQNILTEDETPMRFIVMQYFKGERNFSTRK